MNIINIKFVTKVTINLGGKNMDFVAVDLGASSTRYVSVNSKINFIPNNMVFVGNMNEDVRLEVMYDNPEQVPESNLDVSIWKEGESKFFPVRALIGEMANRYSSHQETPSNNISKVKQQINYVSAVLAVALSKMKDQSIGNNVNMFVALPPSDVQVYKQEMINELKGKYTVAFNKIGNTPLTMQFVINDVACYEESRLAIMQFIFDPKYPERFSKYSQCNMLSIDIGASTTDLVLMQNCKFIDNSGRTYKVGGNIVRDAVIKEIGALRGSDPKKNDADKYIVEGRARWGNKYIDISDTVNKAKEKIARDIVTRIDEYFGNIGIPIYEINYILVSGGGSMGSSYIDDVGKTVPTSQPMSYFITEALRNVCDGIEVINFGDEPRLANIKGLGMIAMKKNGEV